MRIFFTTWYEDELVLRGLGHLLFPLQDEPEWHPEWHIGEDGSGASDDGIRYSDTANNTWLRKIRVTDPMTSLAKERVYTDWTIHFRYGSTSKIQAVKFMMSTVLGFSQVRDQLDPSPLPHTKEL